MKALVCHSYGSLDDIRYCDIDDPAPGPNDVLIGVKAVGAVFTDILFAEGLYQVKPPLPFVLGSEAAGIVLAVGERVTRFKPGDRVMSLAVNFGAYAEKIVLPDWLPSHLPDNVPFEIGASVMSSAATAQHALRQRANIQPGETLVVTGAAGGTGSAAIQVGKLLGARVIAICSNEKRAEFCRSLGADDTLIYTEEDIKEGIKKRTEGRGADVIFETVGGDTFDACARAMAIDGRLLVVGFASGRLPTLAVNLTLVKIYSVIGVHWLTFVKRNPEKHAANMVELAGWLEAGQLRPSISEIMPLSQGVDALKKLKTREVMGKIILTP